jgi:hypothetical protein
MEQLNHVVGTIALTMGAAWASGINLYATILVLGLLGTTGSISLPPDLQILTHPLVLGAAGLMYLVEFAADKMPGVDTGWDALHTFVRIPAGALLAAGAVGHVDPAVALAAGILGAGMAAASHATKAGGRVIINTSPEPFTNWVASIGEDIVVIAGLWTALQYPWVFVILLGLFVLIMAWLLPKIWRGVVSVIRKIKQFFGGNKAGLDLLPPQK